MDEKFWVAVSFVTFFALAWKPVGRILASALDKRSQQIEASLAEASRLREEAQELLASFQRRQREALLEAEEILNKAKAESDLMLREAEKNLEENLNKRIEIAMQKISSAEAQLVQDLKEHAVDLAVSTAQNLLKEKMSKSVSQNLLQHALKDVQKKLH